MPEQNFRDHAQSNFEFFILKMTLDMILKVLFRARSQNIFNWLKKSFGIVPKKNFWDHAQSDFENFILINFGIDPE